MAYEHIPSDIICPYCGHARDGDSDDYGADGEEFKEECQECGKEFCVTVSIDVSWNAQCTPENHEDDGEHRLGRIWCKHCDEIMGEDDSPEAQGWPNGQKV